VPPPVRACLANALILAVRRASPRTHARLAARLVPPLLAALGRERNAHLRAAVLQARTCRLRGEACVWRPAPHAAGECMGLLCLEA
jgi:hypothetical protein